MDLQFQTFVHSLIPFTLEPSGAREASPAPRTADTGGDTTSGGRPPQCSPGPAPLTLRQVSQRAFEPQKRTLSQFQRRQQGPGPLRAFLASL